MCCVKTVLCATGGDYDVLRRTEPTICKVLTMTIDSKTVLCRASRGFIDDRRAVAAWVVVVVDGHF
jgi:hypothetical protein